MEGGLAIHSLEVNSHAPGTAEETETRGWDLLRETEKPPIL